MVNYSYLDGEQYFWSSSRKVLINDQIRIKNIPLFGYIKSQATPPTRLHIHANTLEFTYICKGQQYFSAEGRDYHVFGGEMFVMPGHIPHSTGVAPVEKQEMFWFHINYEDDINFLGLSQENGEILLQRLKGLGISTYHLSRGVRDLLFQVLEGFSQKDALKRVRAVSNLHQILLQVIFGEPSDFMSISDEIGRVVKYLDNNLEKEISLESLADIAFLSLSRFKERFRTEMGVSPREYVNFKKIEKAKEWLREAGDSQTVTDIAMSLGFSSSTYFAVVFKKFTSQTPSEYVASCQSNTPTQF